MCGGGSNIKGDVFFHGIVPFRPHRATFRSKKNRENIHSQQMSRLNKHLLPWYKNPRRPVRCPQKKTSEVWSILANLLPISLGISALTGRWWVQLDCSVEFSGGQCWVDVGKCWDPILWTCWGISLIIMHRFDPKLDGHQQQHHIKFFCLFVCFIFSSS